ncbi:hypothetical protein EYF80_015248 [Liparis tanakae]|uniref:Uncharacterized protein n=1 Tax=Liparis tanakae TaxID=230148 RepID=A0A4Z2I931_9TELE|nr:hypothetical protein EYF80_015248 [Liparis tanakae]
MAGELIRPQLVFTAHWRARKDSYLQPLEDLAPPLVARRGDEGLEDVAARGVGSQRQEVSGGQSAQAAEEERALLELGERLDQPGTVVTDGGQRHLEKEEQSRAAATPTSTAAS